MAVKKPKQLFDLGGVEDPVVRTNFDILNRELLKRQVADEIPPANIAFSAGCYAEGYGPGAISEVFRIQGTRLEITTKGNPVELELVPVEDRRESVFTGSATQPPNFFNLVDSQEDLQFFVGCYRISPGQPEVEVFRRYVECVGFNPGIGSFYASIANGFKYVDTKVSKGLHRYIYTFIPFNTTLSVGIDNLRLMAKEIR